MSRTPLQFVNRWLCVALAIAVGFVILSLPSVAAEPSADDILSQSQKAMQPPIKYRIHTSENDMLVSQKLMPDGSVASRTETKQPIEKISLKLGEEYYDAYPTLGIAIDSQFIFKGANEQASTIASTLKAGTANSAKIKGMVTRDGRECYEIETAIAPDILTALSQLLPKSNRKMLPAGNRYVVDKETFLIVEMETVSQTGESTIKMEYKDIVLKPVLADELFLLPLGMEVQKPKSIREYSAIVAKIHHAEARAKYPIAPRSPPLVRVPQILPTDRPPPLGPIKYDLKGRAIVPVPPGMTQLEFDVLTAPPKPPLKMPPKLSWFRWTLLVLPLGVVLAFLATSRWKAFRSAHMPTK